MKKSKEINNFYKIQNSYKKNANDDKNIKNNKSPKTTKLTKKNGKKRKHVLKKIIFFATLFTVLIVLILRSNLFNIEVIKVENNVKVGTDEILTLSGLQIGQNMFSFNKYKIIDKIKQNAYIENVKIVKKLNKELDIIIEERTANYQIESENNFAYINNQGYILEISSEKLNLPILTGLVTSNISTGARLDVADLDKLNDIIQIINAASIKNLRVKINKIDISDSSNYLIYMNDEKKVIHFGDANNINDKIDWIEYMLEEEKETEGEFFVKNIDKPYFREKVSV